MDKLFSMFIFLKTHKLGLDIIITMVMMLTALIASRDFIRTHDLWRLMVEIIMGVMTMSKISDVIEDLRRKKIDFQKAK